LFDHDVRLDASRDGSDLLNELAERQNPCLLELFLRLRSGQMHQRSGIS
jgi:hypothetical protein